MGGTVTIRNCAVATAGFRINFDKWNWIQEGSVHRYSTAGVFTGYVQDQADVFTSSSRTAMSKNGYYCIVLIGNKVQLVDYTGCQEWCDREVSCEKQVGFCVKGNGADQNHGVVKLNSYNGNTDAMEELCLHQCTDTSDAFTGCEIIWDQSNRGCYRHTREIDRGNGVARHYCWVCN